MNTVTIHNQTYEFYSWEVLGRDIFKIAKNILDDGKEFDRIIALMKGGMAFSKSLVDFLEVKNLSSFQIQFYTNIAETQKTPVITQSLPVSVNDEEVLIFDDIADSGETLELAAKYLKYHGVKSITTAVLITKPWSTFQVDYSARSTEAWVVFPNEIRETITLLVQNWQKKGDAPATIKQNLLKIGFNKEEVALFANLE